MGGRILKIGKIYTSRIRATKSYHCWIENEMRANQNSQAQSHSNMKKMIGQPGSLVHNLIVSIEKGKFLSQPLPNPRGVHEIDSSWSKQQEKAKSIMTLWKGKQFDNKVKTPIKKASQAISLVQVTSKDSSPRDLEEDIPPPYIPKAPFPQRLVKPKQGTITNEIMEIFKQVSINILLLNDIKQVPAYAKFLKDLCTKKRQLYVHKKAFLTE